MEGDVPSTISGINFHQVLQPSSFIMLLAPVGYLTKARQLPVPYKPASREPILRTLNKDDKRGSDKELVQNIDSNSLLDLFIMMRLGKLSPEIANKYDSKNLEEGRAIYG